MFLQIIVTNLNTTSGRLLNQTTANAYWWWILVFNFLNQEFLCKKVTGI